MIFRRRPRPVVVPELEPDPFDTLRRGLTDEAARRARPYLEADVATLNRAATRATMPLAGRTPVELMAALDEAIENARRIRQADDAQQARIAEAEKYAQRLLDGEAYGHGRGIAAVVAKGDDYAVSQARNYLADREHGARRAMLLLAGYLDLPVDDLARAVTR